MLFMGDFCINETNFCNRQIKKEGIIKITVVFRSVPKLWYFQQVLNQINTRKIGLCLKQSVFSEQVIVNFLL